MSQLEFGFRSNAFSSKYTQVVWGDSEELGCGMVFYKDYFKVLFYIQLWLYVVFVYNFGMNIIRL